MDLKIMGIVRSKCFCSGLTEHISKFMVLYIGEINFIRERDQFRLYCGIEEEMEIDWV